MVFVFGSNREGRHGKGAALEARLKHGAIQGQAEGRQGNSYGIVTKELRRHLNPVTLYEVGCGAMRFLVYAASRPEEQFLVTKIGCGLAGFREADIAVMFKDAPGNCKLPDGWRRDR